MNEESMESNEEYLEEVVDLLPEPDVDNNEDSYQSIPPDIQEFTCQEIKIEPVESVYSCQYCEKTFASRSGRDTHQQLKHKCPDDFDPINYICHEHEFEVDGKPCLVWRCPICSHFSKKKDHHRTHMIRHAIREKEDLVKLETESGFVLENEDSQEGQIVFAVEEKSIENFLPPVVSDKPDACQLLVITEEDLFSCTVCHSKFPNEETGKFHVQKFGNSSLCISCVCPDCNVIFPSKKLLKRHQDLHVLDGISHCLNYFECLTCSVVFSNQKDLDAHLKLHVRLPKDGNELYQYQSEYNTKLDGCELQLENFRETWMGTGRLRCGHCSKIANREAMNLHVTFFHASLKCPFDNQEFSRSLGYFVEHMKSKHPGDFKGVTVSFKCPFCKDNFASLTAMKNHCKTCQEKRIDCSHCDKKFFTERQLKLHLSLVSGAKNFKCATCEKTFSNKTELTVHSRMHSNEKPYLCTFPNCDKAFRTNSHRSSHMDTHSNSENYQCSHCEVRFKTRGARRIHEKSHTEFAKSACNICRREFRQRSHMIRHVKVVHGIKCTSANIDQVIGTQIQKVESSTIDESSMEFSS